MFDIYLRHLSNSEGHITHTHICKIHMWLCMCVFFSCVCMCALLLIIWWVLLFYGVPHCLKLLYLSESCINLILLSISLVSSSSFTTCHTLATFLNRVPYKVTKIPWNEWSTMEECMLWNLFNGGCAVFPTFLKHSMTWKHKPSQIYREECLKINRLKLLIFYLHLM